MDNIQDKVTIDNNEDIFNEEGIVHIDLLSDIKEDMDIDTPIVRKKSFAEDCKKQLSVKNISITVAIIVILGVLFGARSALNTIIVTQNTQAIHELALHDAQAINNVLYSEWSHLELIPYELKGMDNKGHGAIARNLKSIRQADTDAITYLITDEGYCYQSNGITTKNEELINIANNNDNRFIVISDAAGLNTDNNDEAYLIMGVKTNNTTLAGENIIAVLRKTSAHALDGSMSTKSFDGQGISGILNSDGIYIVHGNHSAEEHSHVNEDEILKKAADSKYSNFDEIKADIEKNAAVTFNYNYEGTEYYEYISLIEDTDWYYYLRVPSIVFRAQSARIMALFIAMIGIIVLFVLYFTVNAHFNASRKARRENEFNQQIAESLIKAENANKSKSLFLNTVSHDIRTPLSAIKSYAKLAKSHIEEPDMVMDCLDKINQSSSHVLALVNDILDLGRIEAGKASVEESRENIDDIFDGIKNMLINDIERKNHTYSVDLSTVINHNIICDKLRLDQVLLNIISNAIKYTPDGGEISVKVRELYAKKEGKHLFEFVIKDNGIGMSKDYVSNVFAPFSRDTNNAARSLQGTGLGMTIAKNVVELMGGKISCDSALGKGTEFTFTIPLETYE